MQVETTLQLNYLPATTPSRQYHGKHERAIEAPNAASILLFLLQVQLLLFGLTVQLVKPEKLHACGCLL